MKLKHEATIQIPKCWNHLINEVFYRSEADGNLYTETTNKLVTSCNCLADDDIADPDPHYDDYREVHTTFLNGVLARLSLSSGQNNYYGGLALEKNGGLLYCSEGEEESFHETMNVEIGDDTYVLTVKTGEQP